MAKSYEEAFEEVGRKLGLHEGFLQSLHNDNDDWSFVIKAHALIEAVSTHWICEVIGKEELREVISQLEMSNSKRGKGKFLEVLGLIDSEAKRFLRNLSELRNTFAHDVKYVEISLPEYYSDLSDGDKKKFIKAWKFSFASETSEKVKKELIEIMPKTVIWMGIYRFFSKLAMLELQRSYEEEITALETETRILKDFAADMWLREQQKPRDEKNSGKSEGAEN